MEVTESAGVKETGEENKETGGNLFKDILNIRDNSHSNNKIFKDKKKTTSDYIPSKLPGRENECKELASVLSDAFRGDIPMNIFIYGTPGTGKTSVIKRVFDEMEKFQRNNKKNNVDVKFTAINLTGLPWKNFTSFLKRS
ncbi:MAG: hypothetical protein CVT89_07935 [Candidatus Altiarchaeales archaeon HGW-Altiarchaeales-2]|nr:MAG: hypothetical protein CVT89_07935 [Candidatus Altiarchaeales archaeon HGW-Altiarchaeales-2]